MEDAGDQLTPFLCYVLLLATCIALPYLLGVPPRTTLEWRLMVATTGFLTWLLLGFVSLRSL